MKYKIAVFYVLKYGWTQKRHYHIITWKIGKPWRTYETVLYYLPRKRLSNHYILLHLPGECRSYATATPVFKLILEARTEIKEATKIVEYERSF